MIERYTILAMRSCEEAVAEAMEKWAVWKGYGEDIDVIPVIAGIFSEGRNIT